MKKTIKDFEKQILPENINFIVVDNSKKYHATLGDYKESIIIDFINWISSQSLIIDNNFNTINNGYYENGELVIIETYTKEQLYKKYLKYKSSNIDFD